MSKVEQPKAHSRVKVKQPKAPSRVSPYRKCKRLDRTVARAKHVKTHVSCKDKSRLRSLPTVIRVKDGDNISTTSKGDIDILIDGSVTIGPIEATNIHTFAFDVSDSERTRLRAATTTLANILEEESKKLQPNKRYCISIGTTTVVFVTPGKDGQCRDGCVTAGGMIIEYWMSTTESMQSDIKKLEETREYRILGIQDTDPDSTASVSYQPFYDSSVIVL